MTGAALTVAASRVLSSLLFGVTPTDAASFVSANAALLFVAAAATFLPAWRASSVDPVVALRRH